MRIFFLDQNAEKFVVDIIKSRLEETKQMKNDENNIPTFLDVFVKALENSNLTEKTKEEGAIDNDQFENDAKLRGFKDGQNLYSNQEEFESALISNLFLLFFAGFDTQSTGLSIVLYYLATNQEGNIFLK